MSEARAVSMERGLSQLTNKNNKKKIKKRHEPMITKAEHEHVESNKGARDLIKGLNARADQVSGCR